MSKLPLQEDDTAELEMPVTPRITPNTLEKEPVPPTMGVKAYICWDLGRRFIETRPNWPRLAWAIGGVLVLLIFALRGVVPAVALVKALANAGP